MRVTAPIIVVRARRRLVARSKSIALIGRAGSPSSARSPHRSKKPWPSSPTLLALRLVMPITLCSRYSSMPGWAALTSSSARAPHYVAGATGWRKPSTASAIATPATRHHLSFQLSVVRPGPLRGQTLPSNAEPAKDRSQAASGIRFGTSRASAVRRFR